MTTSNAPHTKTKRTYHIERHTLPNGAVLEHRHGWMNKSQVARALGYSNASTVDNLPLHMVEVPRNKRTQDKGLEPLCRYRLNEVCEYVTQHTRVNQPMN